jgi:hypothetical protein
MATIQVIDFKKVDEQRTPIPRRPRRGKDGKILSMTKKQLRERARRSKEQAASADFALLHKPISEWDAAELARGRPRDRAGGFTGRAPKWITRELHEEAMTRFRATIRDGMNDNTNIAISTIKEIMESDEVDHKGRPIVAASTKLDAAKFLIDHTLGKPKQRVETDISIKMQGMLATAIITPGMLPAAIGSKELTSPRESYDEAEWWEEDDGD